MHIKQTIHTGVTMVLENHKVLKHFCFLVSFFANQAISDNLMNFSLSANLELFLRSSSCCWGGKVNWFPVVVRVKGFYFNLWESREHCVIIRGERHFRQDFKCDAPCDAVGDWDAKIVSSSTPKCVLKSLNTTWVIRFSVMSSEVTQTSQRCLE